MRLSDIFRRTPSLDHDNTQLPLWKKRWFQLVSIALLCTLATTIDSAPSQAETIPPEPVPWLADLPCEDYFTILETAQKNVFGNSFTAASLGDTSFQSENIPSPTIDSAIISAETVDSGLSWILPHLKRQVTPEFRLPFSYNPGPSPRVISVEVADGRTISFQVAGSLMVTTDSGIPAYNSAILDRLRQEGKLISGPNLLRPSFDPHSCDIPDDQDHRSLSLGFTYGEESLALISITEPLPITHLEFKALNHFNGSSWEAVINSILLAAEMQAQVLNISIIGLPDPYIKERLLQAIAYAETKGLLIVVAAGNKDTESMAQYMPACAAADNLIRVLALQSINGKVSLWPGSNTYCPDRVDNSIAAPGYNIPSFDREGHPTVAGGTSMAAPIVSLISALNSMDSAGQPLPLDERIALLRERLQPGPGTINEITGRPDIYPRATFLRCKDLEGACDNILFLPLISLYRLN
jgi:hypothetical protein